MNEVYMLMCGCDCDYGNGYTEDYCGVFFEKNLAEHAAREFIEKLHNEFPSETKINEENPLEIVSISDWGCGWCHWRSIRYYIEEAQTNTMLDCIKNYVDPLADEADD